MLPLLFPTSETGDSMICETCEKREAIPGEIECDDCLSNRAEAYWERRQEGECFRGGEAASYEAEQQAWIQRNLK